MNRHPSPVSRRAVLGALGATAAAFAVPAFAQARYPAKPIKLLVGYAPGGSVDMAARVAADILSAKLGATVVVENLAGAAGVVAAQRAVSSPADGYTLLAGSSNEMAATALVNPAQRYSPQKDLTPVGLIATAPVLLVAAPRAGVKNLDEFIALVKRSPGKYSYGNSGVGSTLHFAGELVKQRAGIFLTHIPYRGTAPLTSDLVGGTLDFAIMSPTAAAPFIQSGRIVPLGITSAKRFPTLPQVPALGEHPQLKGYELTGWFALAGPKDLPAPIVQALREALQSGLTDPAIRRRLEEGGSVPGTGKEDLARIMREDTAKYAELVKFANVRE
ncbi:Bug family tripartite tricarboxylate transporter substrate binding protein [Ramlibacter sp. Leaf400]|uniref:Bug family tripartite tricarboxylate transporter substrate binding protein n=1 Tax=Ramlibacter sp. Leaf400 TaxID=1736365 RepID=UPI0006F8A497|nr:tripartite tricarboxylate transporter substrate binding protein [Ramlibacter sp. Leaf400]KQT11421.1 ABC transporter substrate-binding protein [Ramlibacter sp. Leaf400]